MALALRTRSGYRTLARHPPSTPRFPRRQARQYQTRPKRKGIGECVARFRTCPPRTGNTTLATLSEQTARRWEVGMSDAPRGSWGVHAQFVRSAFVVLPRAAGTCPSRAAFGASRRGRIERRAQEMGSDAGRTVAGRTQPISSSIHPTIQGPSHAIGCCSPVSGPSDSRQGNTGTCSGFPCADTR